MGGKHYAHTMDGNGNFIGNWTKGHLCHAPAKNLSASCLYPGFIRQRGFQGSTAHCSSMGVAFSQIWRKHWERRAEQRDFKNLHFDQKRSTQKVLAKEEVVTKKKSRALS